MEEKAGKEEAERCDKWVKYFRNRDNKKGKSDGDSTVTDSKTRNDWGSDFDANRLVVKSDRIKELIYKGVPDRVRGEVWLRLLGVSRLRFQQNGVYVKMRTRAFHVLELQHVSQIDKDVNRCFRNHEMFKDRYSEK